jgi:hypothetical protein
VAQQNAKKCSHQGGGNLVANFFRRPPESSHGNY